MNGASVSLYRCGRQKRPRRLVHEGHEFVGKAGHRTSNANAAHIRASADSTHPAALSHIALNHGTPASQLHNAKRRPVYFGKLSLFIEATAVATFVHGVAKKPGRPQ